MLELKLGVPGGVANTLLAISEQAAKIKSECGLEDRSVEVFDDDDISPEERFELDPVISKPVERLQLLRQLEPLIRSPKGRQLFICRAVT